MSWGQQKQQGQQVFKKRSEDDEDTLSLDSEKSQGFINEQVGNWPAWSVDGQQNQNPFMRYQVNSYPIPADQVYGNSQIPIASQQAKKTPQIPVYFSRGPVYQPPQQYQPIYNNQPQQPQFQQ